MTKYKKLTRSSFVIVALCLALVGILAFGGTYAYFSSSAKVEGTVKLGTLTLTENSGYAKVNKTDSALVVPNEPLVATKVDVGSNIDHYVRLVVTVKVTLASDKSIDNKDAKEPDLSGVVVLTGLDGYATKTDSNTTYYYIKDTTTDTNAKKLSAGTTSYEVTGKISENVGANESDVYMGATIEYTVTVEAIQANYLGDNTTDALTIDALHAGWATWANKTVD